MKDFYVWFNVEMGRCIEEWIYVSINICRREEMDICVDVYYNYVQIGLFHLPIAMPHIIPLASAGRITLG